MGCADVLGNIYPNAVLLNQFSVSFLFWRYYFLIYEDIYVVFVLLI